MLRTLAFLLLAIPATAQSLKVMTFNVRYPNPGDGPDVWAARRDFLVETVAKEAPDLMGTQELFHEQGQYIVEKLPAYAWFGVSRRGNTQDEHMGVFYAKDKLTLIDSGNFWLSEIPERPGSISWNMSLPRMVTWGLFEHKASSTKFMYYNTHFAHRREDEPARMKSAKLIAARLALYDESLPLLLTGDFNAPAGGPAYSNLSQLLKDAWLTAEKKEGPEGTFHGFKGTPGNARIDWIMFRAPWRVTRVAALTVNKDGRYPSDHFPVVAEFALK
jgi:endonuclease/exonuclease/phosphatase family metal-dependent hydrolase